MKVLDRYVLRELIRPTVFGLFMFGSLWMVNLLITTVNLFVTKGVALPTVLAIFAYSLPTVAITAAPMATLLGALLAMGRLNADSEIIAAKGCGIGYSRLMRPVLAVGLGMSLLSFWFNDQVVPAANEAREELFTNEVVLKKPLPRIAKDVFFDGGDQFRVYVRAFHPERAEMEDVTCYQFAKNGFPQVTEAAWARMEGGKWIFRDGRTFVYRPNGALGQVVEFKEWIYPFSLRHGGRTAGGPKSSKEMSLGELRAHIIKRKSQGVSTVLDEADYWWKTAFPFASFFLVLVGAPLAARNVRGGGAGVGLAILLMFVYYVLLAVGNAMGESGNYPPLVCAWAANGIMAVVGIWLVRRSST